MRNRLPMKRMASNPPQDRLRKVNEPLQTPNPSVQDGTPLDLIVYERGLLKNKELRGILERLYLQCTEFIGIAREAYNCMDWNDRSSKNARVLRTVIHNFLGALYLPLPGHPMRPYALCCLAECLKAQYLWHGGPEKLKEAILYRKASLPLCREGSSKWSFNLYLLAGDLMTWSSEEGEIEHVEEAVSYCRQALAAYPSSDTTPERIRIMSRLGGSLLELYERKGSVHHLNEAIKWLRMAKLSLPPVEHRERCSILNSLAQCLVSRYEQKNKLEYLNEAIQYFREAISMHDPKDSERDVSINNLAVSLLKRYDQLTEIQDVEEAIQCLREVISMYPIGDTRRLNAQVNLSSCLGSHHAEQGGFEELEEAIKHLREVLLVSSTVGARRTSGLAIGNLGSCLYNRFLRTNMVQDLDDAIQYHREDLSLYPADSPRSLVALNNLSMTLRARYTLKSVTRDVDEAAHLLLKGLSLCPQGHSERPLILTRLANCFQAKYEHTDGLQLLQCAIQYYREALSLYSPRQQGRLIALQRLAKCLRAQYGHSGDVQSLEDAAESLHELIRIMPSAHHLQVVCLSSLAWIYAKHGKVLKAHHELPDSSALFEKACNHPTGTLKFRLDAAQEWISTLQDPPSLQAYRHFLKLADQYLLLRPSITSRHQLIRSIPDEIALDAAAIAIETGELKTAVELLEQGRTLIWSQMNRYRTPLDELQTAHPELAAKFTRLSQLLENSATSEIFKDGSKLTVEQEATKYRKISEEWSDVVDQIRQLDGFHTFLHPPQYSHLRLSSRDGAVILLNASSKRCDAIIILEEGDPVLVPLPDTERSDIHGIATKFYVATEAGLNERHQILGVLRSLWDNIVLPVVNKLQELNVASGSRIWWCPTYLLAMLPIHAAGPHRGNKLNLCDIYISSYTPTLSTLARLSQTAVSPKCDQTRLDLDPRFLVVAQPDTPGQVHIPCVKEELTIIQKQIPEAMVLLSEEGTCDRVIAGLKTHNWIHFTCHGSQNYEDPFASSFCLHDKPLNLLDIIEARVPNAEFAFLSACHSAATDIGRPDETIHLAAALQFTGFRSVIGTMYAMADIDGPIVAEEVYKHMYRQKEKGESVDYRDAAEALSIATRRLRENGVPVERWINFVHFGA